MNRIPLGWKLMKLGELADWGSGGTPNSNNPEYYNGNIPWIIIGDLNDGNIYSSSKRISQLGLQNSSAKLVPIDNVLVAMYGSIGKLGINRIPLATNQAIAFTKRIKHDTYNKYLFYYLLSIRNFLFELGKGGTQKNISQTILKEVKIPVPPIETQFKIVSKIEELFSELDKAVESLKTAQQQLKVYRQAVLKAAFEGNGLFSAFSNNFSPMKLEKIADAIDPQPSHRTPPEVKGGIPYVGISEVDKTTNKINFQKARKISIDILQEHITRYPIYDDDFAIGKIGTIGKPFKVPTLRNYTLSANVVLIQPKRDKVLPDYLYYLFQSIHIEKQFITEQKATTQAAFGIKKVRAINIPYCDLNSQSDIIDKLKSILKTIEQLENKITFCIDSSDVLRKTVLKQAFEGKLC
jgi:type I restriction enzyme, S subunit